MPAPGFETYGEPTSYPNSSTGKPDSCSASEEESIKVRHHGYQGPNIDLENAYGAKEGPLWSYTYFYIMLFLQLFLIF